MKKFNKEKMENVKKKIGKWMLFTYTMLSVHMIELGMVYADDDKATTLEDSPLVNGITDLIEDATTVATGIGAIATVLLVIYNLIKAQAAEDEGDAKVIKKKIKKILIYGVGITIASGMISIITGYFK